MLISFYRPILFCIVLLSSFPSGVKAVQKNDSDSSQINSILNLTYNCQFDDASKFVNDLAAEDPASIKWKFFQSFVLWQRLIFLDSAGVGNQNAEVQFTNSIERVIDTTEGVLSRNPNDTTALFYAGFGLGYLAKFDANKGDKFKAAREGSKGLSYHKKLLSICPNCYDVYFSLALFNYYTSYLPWYMKPIAFILGGSGSKEEAQEYLSLVATKGTMAKYEAYNILGELYAREEKFDSVSISYTKLISQFPGASLFYLDRIAWAYMEGSQYQLAIRKCKEATKIAGTWNLSYMDSLYVGKIYFRMAAAYEKLGNYSAAMDTYNELINRYGSLRTVSEAHLSIGRLYEKANDPPDAIREYEWVVNKASSPELQKEAHDRLGDLGVR